jgi:hypothetical protein
VTEIQNGSESRPKDPRPKSNWAQIASVVVAVVAVVGISLQIHNNNKNAQRASARQVYMSYSEAALKYPEFDEPNLEKIKAEPLKFVQYEEYVAHMLFAYDEILTVDDVPAWHKTFEHDLAFHKAYLCEEISQDFSEVFFPKMQKLLKEFKAKSCQPNASNIK